MAGPDTGHPAGAARPLDRYSPMPLWAQLRDDLRRRLEAGAFDEAFPGELALVAEYAVSRHTVRSALRELRADGLVIAERGRRPEARRGHPDHAAARDAVLPVRLGRIGRAPPDEHRPGPRCMRRWSRRGSAPAGSIHPVVPPRTPPPRRRRAPRTRHGLAARRNRRPASRRRLHPHRALRRTRQPRRSADRGRKGNHPRGRTGQGPAAPAEHSCHSWRRSRSTALGYAGGRPVEWRHTLIRGDRFSLVAESSPRAGYQFQIDSRYLAAPQTRLDVLSGTG